MPELHKLTPYLGVLQDRGFVVALVTDAAHVRCVGQGAGGDPCSARKRSMAAGGLRDGDLMRVDGQGGVLEVLVDAAELADRLPGSSAGDGRAGLRRELFGFMRAAFSSAEQGASVFTAGLEVLR